MSSVLRSAVTGVGGYLPADIVTNDELSKVVDTNDAWIVERTGIHARHRAAPDEAAGRRRPHARRDRPDHRGHHHAGPDLSSHRGHRAAQAGRTDPHRLRRP